MGDRLPFERGVAARDRLGVDGRDYGVVMTAGDHADGPLQGGFRGAAHTRSHVRQRYSPHFMESYFWASPLESGDAYDRRGVDPLAGQSKTADLDPRARRTSAALCQTIVVAPCSAGRAVRVRHLTRDAARVASRGCSGRVPAECRVVRPLV